MISWYRFILAVHVIAVISWMAGILYLYRFFVYHADETEDVVKNRFVLMEDKLYRIITYPAMWVSLMMGSAMVGLQPYLLETHWFRLKIILFLLLIAVTLWAGSLRKQLSSGSCRISSRQFRFINEIPTLLMIGIVFLVILKPF